MVIDLEANARTTAYSLFFLGWRRNQFLDAWDGDRTVRVYKCSKQLD